MSDHVWQLGIALVAAVPGLLAWLKARAVGNQVQEVHLSMNSRMDEMLKLARAAAHAEGLNEGALAEQQRAAGLATETPVTVTGSPITVIETPKGESDGK